MGLPKHSSNPAELKYCSLTTKKHIKVKNNALIRLKYIHNRILDHIKMKKFLEGHEVSQFLNQINKLITNEDEIEAFRKRIKNMLLSINDSIMEFEQAISSGEITFSSLQMSKNDMIAKKASGSSSGVSTLGETPSLSSLALTNVNFHTVPSNVSSVNCMQNESLEKTCFREIAVQTIDTSLDLSSLALTNRNFYSQNNEADEKNCSEQQNQKVFSNSLTLNEGEGTCNIEENTLRTENSSWMKESLLELTNNTQNLVNNATPFNNSSVSQTAGRVSQDLFLEPFPIGTCSSRFKPKSHFYTKNKNGHMHTRNCPEEQKNCKSTNHSSSELKMNNYVKNFNNLSLKETENIDVDQYVPSGHSSEKNEREKNELEILGTQENNEYGCSLMSVESEETNDVSEQSEIYFFSNLGSFGNFNPKQENNLIAVNNDCVLGNNKQPNENFIDKSHNFHKKNSEQSSLEKDHMEIQKTKNISTSDVGYSIPDSFSQILQVQNTPHISDNSSSKGIKRRFIDGSTNLEMINGSLIPETENRFILPEDYPIHKDKAALSASVNCPTIRCDVKDIEELDKELQEAMKECSIVWNEFTHLLNEEKKELMKSKKSQEVICGNGKLKFPPGYEKNHNYLEELLVEFKTTIGIPSNIYQVEDQDLFFEDAMNNWEELRKIVQNIGKHEKK